MPDKKLTDSEIVKALECCTQGRDIKVCWDCPLYVELETARECCEKLNTNARDLINRLQAENERSKDYIATLEKEVDWYRDELRHSDKKVANKAYKEVFEKINEKAEVRKIKIFGRLHILKVVLLHDINEIKHEMVGEDNGKM